MAVLAVVGEGPEQMLELFRDDHFADVSLNQWLGLSPAELVSGNVDVSDEQLHRLLSWWATDIKSRAHVAADVRLSAPGRCPKSRAR